MSLIWYILKLLLPSVAVHELTELTLPPSVERKLTSDPSLVSIFKIISVRRKKGFWTWSEKMLIFRKMRGDIWRTNILQGAEIIELYLLPKKSAIGWIFGPQTAFESTSSNLRPKTVWCLDFVLSQVAQA